MTNAKQLLKASREIKQIYVDIIPVGNGKTMNALQAAIDAVVEQHLALCCNSCGMYKTGEGGAPADECIC